MAVLPDVDRQRISTGLQRYWSGLREGMPLNKVNLLAAVAATDAWVEANAAAYNAALPAAARNGLTATQKTLLFCVVAAYRQSKAFAVRLLGEVD
jgi:hypothetical protein